MKYKTITICTAVIFISVAIFGFLSMSMMNHDTHATCPFSVSESSPCPDESKIKTVMHHINSLEEFLGVALNNNILSALLLYIAGAIFYYIGASFIRLKSALHFSVKKYKELHEAVYISFINLLENVKRVQKINSTWVYSKAHYSVFY